MASYLIAHGARTNTHTHIHTHTHTYTHTKNAYTHTHTHTYTHTHTHAHTFLPRQYVHFLVSCLQAYHKISFMWSRSVMVQPTYATRVFCTFFSSIALFSDTIGNAYFARTTHLDFVPSWKKVRPALPSSSPWRLRPT
jgi:hypothetical protein